MSIGDGTGRVRFICTSKGKTNLDKLSVKIIKCNFIMIIPAQGILKQGLCSWALHLN